eukprot:5450473-Pyramimonas_sp.AAC.1
MLDWVYWDACGRSICGRTRTIPGAFGGVPYGPRHLALGVADACGTPPLGLYAELPMGPRIAVLGVAELSSPEALYWVWQTHVVPPLGLSVELAMGQRSA